MNNKERTANAITWIERLLVTRFKQGRDELGNKESGFCCLGLGCYISKIDYNDWQGTNLQFQDHVGLEAEDGLYITPAKTPIYGRGLAALNDAGQSFKAIAQDIIAEPHRYFKPKVASGIKQHFAV